MIDTVTIAGAVVDPTTVLHDVTITHGRRTAVDAGPNASTATIVLAVTALPPYAGGDVLTLAGPAGTLFTGRITDRALEHDPDPAAGLGYLTLTAMGPAARLQYRKVGDAPWPQEPASVRAERIITAAGMTPTIAADPARDHPVIPRDVDAATAAALLAELAAAPPAAVVDTPTGAILYQQLTARAITSPYRWADWPTPQTWDTLDPALTWDTTEPPTIGDWDSPAATPIVLPPAAVDWAPAWQATEGDVTNHVRVGYGTGNPQAATELEHAPSITRHGRRYAYLATQLAEQADAESVAAGLLTARADDRWTLPAVTVDLAATDTATTAALLRAVCGQAVRLDNLPTPAPAATMQAIVEGWTYTQQLVTAGVTRTLTLAISDPLQSVVAMTWPDYPGTYTWADHPTALEWADVLDPSTLGGTT